ncbi:hypothetical protein ACS0TY_031836 [Phlomoides rotata]
MSSPNSHNQDFFFYGKVWTKELTEFLVKFLIIEKNEGCWIWNETNMICIFSAMERINATFGLNFTPPVVHMRVRTLRSRWNMFNHLLSISGVYWNNMTNEMYASPEVWSKILVGGCIHE